MFDPAGYNTPDGGTANNSEVVPSDMNNMTIGQLGNSGSTAVDINAVSRMVEEEYKVYPYRWVILALYALATLCNGIGFISFASIANITLDAFGISETMLLMSSMANVIVYIPVTVPASYILEKYGLRFGINLAMFLSIVGAWIKCLICEGFYLVMIGQVVISLAQPLVGNCIGQVGNEWFPPKQRSVSTTVASIAAPAGLIIAYLIPPAFVDSYYPPTDAGMEKARLDIRNSLICEAIVISVQAVIVILFFKSKPPTPPSPSAVAEKVEFMSSFKALFTNMNYIWVFIVYLAMCGNFNAIAALMGQFAEAYNLSNSEGGWLGTFLTIWGVVGAALSGFLLTKTGKYKLLNFISAIVTTFGFVMYGLLLRTENFWWIFFGTFIMSIQLFGSAPICYELSIEVTFPVSESMTSGLLITGGQVGALIVTFSIDGIIGKDPTNRESIQWSILLMAVVNGVAAIASLLSKEDLRRLKNDAEDKLIKQKHLET